MKNHRIRIANLKDTKVGIKCDRSTILGNPFILKNELMRRTVVQAYREYLHYIVNTWASPEEASYKASVKHSLSISPCWIKTTHEDFVRELTRIEQYILSNEETVLLCWCAPKLCHCHILANYFKWWLTR